MRAVEEVAGDEDEDEEDEEGVEADLRFLNAAEPAAVLGLTTAEFNSGGDDEDDDDDDEDDEDDDGDDEDDDNSNDGDADGMVTPSCSSTSDWNCECARKLISQKQQYTTYETECETMTIEIKAAVSKLIHEHV